MNPGDNSESLYINSINFNDFVKAKFRCPGQSKVQMSSNTQ
ncbi:hypothetical protein L369_04731 [Enterobacter sp. MGH 23]|nr:hypothetical protein L369_04731 [Enterobacter sp. MGH 23]